MTISVRGVVSRGKGEPVEVTTVLVPEPGPGEVVVRIGGAGACHSDLHVMHDYPAGLLPWPTPFTLGAGLAGWALMSLSYLPMLRLYRLSPLRAPGLPLIALLYAAMTADSARRHYAGRGAEWRGRTNRTRLRLLRDDPGSQRR